jgi:hypothetical protein
MVENQEEKILKDIQVCFSIQDIGIIRNGRINDHKYKIKIKEKDGKEIEPTDIDLDSYYFETAIDDILKLFEIFDLTSNEKLIEGIKDEILKRIAVLVFSIY